MPTVLITGINGFVAIHTAVQFLENGWDVRGTVRSEEKGKKALAVPAFEKYKGKVTYVIVEDLIEGDFTEALEGVEAVSAIASLPPALGPVRGLSAITRMGHIVNLWPLPNFKTSSYNTSRRSLLMVPGRTLRISMAL